MKRHKKIYMKTLVSDYSFEHPILWFLCYAFKISLPHLESTYFKSRDIEFMTGDFVLILKGLYSSHLTSGRKFVMWTELLASWHLGSNVTSLCVLFSSLFTLWADCTIRLLHVNLPFLSAFRTVAHFPLATLCQYTLDSGRHPNDNTAS